MNSFYPIIICKYHYDTKLQKRQNMYITVGKLLIDIAVQRGAHKPARDDERSAKVLVLEPSARARSVSRDVQSSPLHFGSVQHSNVIQ